MNVHPILTAMAETVADEDFAIPIGLALDVKRTIDDPDASMEQMAKLVLSDPALAKAALAVANSAAYRRSGREVTDVKSATLRLGFKTVRSMTTALVVRQMRAMAPTPASQALLVRLWEHVAHVGALSAALARRVTHQDPEEAIFTGIVHESAAFFLIVNAGFHPGLLDGADGSLSDWEDWAEARIGRALHNKMDLPRPVREAIEASWTAPMANPPRSLTDTLLLAHAISPVASPLDRLTGKSRMQPVELEESLIVSLREDAREHTEDLLNAIH